MNRFKTDLRQTYDKEECKTECTQVAADASQPSSVERALSDLGAAIQRADVGMERLRGRLKPILSHEEPAGSPESECPPPACEMEDRIQQLTRHVEVIGQCISSVTSRICV